MCQGPCEFERGKVFACWVVRIPGYPKLYAFYTKKEAEDFINSVKGCEIIPVKEVTDG